MAASGAGDVAAGNRLFKKGKFREAAEQYGAASVKNPKEPAIDYDLGAAYYKSGDFDKAVDSFQKALLTDDEKLRPKVYYNLGNALYKAGISREDQDIQQTIKQLEESTANYDKALASDPKDGGDAQFNRDFVAKEIERLKEKQKQMRQQRQNQGQDKNQPKDRQKDQQENQSSDQQKGRQNQGDQSQKNSVQDRQNQQGSSGSDKKGRENANQSGQKNDVPQSGEDRAGQKESGENKDQSSAQAKQGKERSQPVAKDKSQQTGEQKDAGQKADAAGQSGDGQVLSREEARAVLDDFDQNDQPKGLLNFFNETRESRPVDKDW